MKYIKCIILVFFLTPICCFASTNTFQRTNDNLIVPNDVIVDSSNINAILKTPAVSSMEKIYDYANLYSDKEEKKLFQQISQYIEKTNIDAVLVTTKNLNGFSLSDYAYHFYDYNDFKNSGVIFVVYIDNLEPHVFMGSNGLAASIYSDVYIQQVLKYFIKDAKSKNYYEATGDYYRILDELYKGDGEYRVNSKGEVVKIVPWIEIVIIAISLSFIVTFMILSLLKRKRKKFFRNLFVEKLNNDTLMVKLESDDLIDTLVNNK